jgi:hypothetical protein
MSAEQRASAMAAADTGDLADSGGGRRPEHRGGDFAYVWGLAGVVALFATAVIRLGSRGIEAVRTGLGPAEWLILVLLSAAFVWGEGVHALQRKWVPWVIERLQALRHEGRTWYRALAPLHAMAFIGAPPRTMARAWAGCAAIIVAVLVVSRFPQPWRGIVDIAVASALLWATLVLIVTGVRAARR